MAALCECQGLHPSHRIVLTGGPGGGKTAVLELLRQSLCRHVTVLPEAAGIVFGGGFPREEPVGVRRAAQRAIYYVQRELEAASDAMSGGVALCDRGVVDGAAYWPGPEDFWTAVGSTRAEMFARYHAVIHLRVPDAINGYGNSNPLRTETWQEAVAIDDAILRAWQGHPRVHVVGASPDFLTKAERALDLLRAELPACCRAGAAWRSELAEAVA